MTINQTVLHKTCFKCATCRKTLNLTTFVSSGSFLYCPQHKPKVLVRSNPHISSATSTPISNSSSAGRGNTSSAISKSVRNESLSAVKSSISYSDTLVYSNHRDQIISDSFESVLLRGQNMPPVSKLSITQKNSAMESRDSSKTEVKYINHYIFYIEYTCILLKMISRPTSTISTCNAIVNIDKTNADLKKTHVLDFERESKKEVDYEQAIPLSLILKLFRKICKRVSENLIKSVQTTAAKSEANPEEKVKIISSIVSFLLKLYMKGSAILITFRT